jgi:hypothetical protein
MANLEVPTENLLNAVVRLPAKEFECFIEKARKLRQNPTKPRWTKSEIWIIKEVNECVLSPEKQSRYGELVEKRQDEKITAGEMDELIALTDETEELSVRRLENLVRLAISSKKSLDEIMEELEIHSPSVV